MVCVRYFIFKFILLSFAILGANLYSSPKVQTFGLEPSSNNKNSLNSTPYTAYITGVGVRVRKDSNTTSRILGTLSIGEAVQVIARSKKPEKIGSDTSYWYKIRKDKMEGWVFGSFILPGGNKEEWQTLGLEMITSLKSPIEISEAIEIHQRWKKLESDSKDSVYKVSFRFFQCLTIQNIFNHLKPDMESNPSGLFQKWLKTLDQEVYFYHELAGMYQLKADYLWKMAEKNSNHPLTEEIRYIASRLYLGGECEGYVPCHLSTLILTDLEYIKLHPNGKYSKEILESVKNSLSYLDENYTYPDKSDIDEYKMYLQLIFDARNIVKKTKGSDTDVILKRLQELEDRKPEDNKSTDQEN